MKALSALMMIIGLTINSHAQSKDFFRQADSFFTEYVANGKVDYNAIKADPKLLNSLVNQVKSTEFNSRKSAKNKAFLINTYNLLTINSIIQNGIPKSPLDVTGFFDEQTHNVAGKQLTLDQIEKKMLLPEYKDSRIHFVLVCAAIGCPPLKPFAYVPEKLDQQMEEATIAALNNDYFIRVDPENKHLLVSEIFNWYEEDFLAEADSILAYINKYRNEKIPSDYEVGRYTYDWSLNKQQD